MLRKLCVKCRRKSPVIDAAVCSHEQQLHILCIARKEGWVGADDDKQAIASGTFLALLCNKHEGNLIFREEICDSGVVLLSKVPWVLDKPGWMHVGGRVKRPSLHELSVVFQLNGHRAVHDAMDEVHDTYVPLKHDGGCSFVPAEHIDITYWQTPFILPGDVAIAVLVKHLLQCQVRGFVENFKHVEIGTLCHVSATAATE